MEWLTDPNAWVGLLTLTVLELVLGIDNIVFISILSGKLPAHQQNKARTIGLSLAMIMRILLLFSITWVTRLTRPLFAVAGLEITGRAMILVAGGLFLLVKSTHEIHDHIEGEDEHRKVRAVASFFAVLVQISLLDIVFSLDSVITAVGMVDQVAVMIIAVIVAVIVMMIFAKPCERFRRTSSNDQDARAQFFPSDRRKPHRRRSRFSYSSRLHIFRDGILAFCRNAQPEDAIPKTCAARATKPAFAESDQSNRRGQLNL